MKFRWSGSNIHAIEFLRWGNVIRLNDIRVIRKMIPFSKGVILDIGSGDAFWSLRITNNKDVSVVYTDINLKSLQRAKARGLAVVCADASALPFRSQVFVGVHSVSVFQFVPDVPALFAEVFNSLRKNGYLAFCADSFTGKGYQNGKWKDRHVKIEGVVTFFSKKKTEDRLNKAGFRVEQLFCVLGNSWWKLAKFVYWLGPFQPIFYLMLSPLIGMAYSREYDTGHKLFSLAVKE